MTKIGMVGLPPPQRFRLINENNSINVCLYSFFYVDLTRCNVWLLDGDLYHKSLLKFAVTAQSLPDCLAVFVADMSRPWTIMESLQKWAGVLRDHVDALKIPPEGMREMEQRSE